MSEPLLQRTDWKRAFEMVFIIGGPILSLWAVTLVSHPRQSTGSFLYDPATPTWFIVFSAVITHTHVMMVFYRSHLNEKIFKLYPVRFLIIPVVFLMIAGFSSRFLGIMGLVAFYWDEWHTILQTFGFGRIYDAREGNDPNLGRRLDIGVSFVLCLFPHLIMLTYLPEAQRTAGLEEVLMMDPLLVRKYGPYIHDMRYPLMIFGGTYLIYYFYRYRTLVKNGYKISRGKIALLGSTCFSAVIIALFYSIADAAYYFNIYHALQYMFIVCLSEVPQLSERFRLPKIPKGLGIFLCGTVVITLATAAGIARDSQSFSALGNFWLLSSLLHFWYDGFIWSVRRKQVV